MIFDNKLNHEQEGNNLVNEINFNNNTQQKDKINYILFSQTNTPIKINFELNKDKSANENKITNFNNTLISPNKRHKLNSNFSKINLEKYNPNSKTEPFEDINELKNFPTNKNSSPNLNFNNTTPIKRTPYNNNNSIAGTGNSLQSQSNISKGIALNKISLNLVHRGLMDYHYINRTHFRTRVTKGPPVCLRWVSWLVLNNIDAKKSDKIVDYYLSKNLDYELDKQISKDLDRTFSNLNSNYLNSELLKNSLSRILKAYAALDTDLGYCQGLNLVTANLLIVCNYNERDVFYILISILSSTFGNNFSIRGFFTDEFPLLKFYVFLFEEIFEKSNKKLKQHFDKIDLPSDLWVTKWFQTLFTICLPVEICQRLWDCLFSQGLSFLISFSLALLKEFEVKLLRKNDNFDLLEFFNKLLNSLANEILSLNDTVIVIETKNRVINIENNEFNIDKPSNNIIDKNCEEGKGNNQKNNNISNNKKNYSFNIEKIIKEALKIPISEKLIKKIKKKYDLTNGLDYNNNNEEVLFDNNIIFNINYDEIDAFNEGEYNNTNSNLNSVSNQANESKNNSENVENKINFEEFNNKEVGRMISEIPDLDFENDIEEREFIYNEGNIIVPKLSSNFDIDFEDHEIPKNSSNYNKNDIGEAIKKLNENNINYLTFKKEDNYDNDNYNQIRFIEKSKEKDNIVIKYNNENTSPRFKAKNSPIENNDDDNDNEKPEEISNTNYTKEINPYKKENLPQIKDMNFFDFQININKESKFYKNNSNNNIQKVKLKNSINSIQSKIDIINKDTISSNLTNLIKKQELNQNRKSLENDEYQFINENISINEKSEKPKILLKVSSSKKLLKKEQNENKENKEKSKNFLEILDANNLLTFQSLSKDLYTKENEPQNLLSLPEPKVLKFEEEENLSPLNNNKKDKDNFLINTRNISNKRINLKLENKEKTLKKPPIDKQNKKVKIEINENNQIFKENKQIEQIDKMQEIQNTDKSQSLSLSNENNSSQNEINIKSNDDKNNQIKKKDIKESIFKRSKNNPLYIWKKD